MRPAFACLLALGLAQCASPPPPPSLPAKVAEEAVPDAQFCARPQEKTAFQVAALKSRLMVTALACNAPEKYNAFVNANRAGLVPQERTLNGYFARNYGRRGATAHDEYITNLANAQSRRRIIDNYYFCSDGHKLFADAAALQSPTDVVALASSHVITQPMNITECPVQASPAPQQPAGSRQRANR